MIKRCMDFMLALVGVVFLFPLLVCIALWVKFDSLGPVFFLHERIGRNFRPFRMYKFRTMCANAGLDGGEIALNGWAGGWEGLEGREGRESQEGRESRGGRESLEGWRAGKVGMAWRAGQAAQAGSAGRAGGLKTRLGVQHGPRASGVRCGRRGSGRGEPHCFLPGSPSVATPSNCRTRLSACPLICHACPARPTCPTCPVRRPTAPAPSALAPIPQA